jgi:hypothetical protein
MKLWKKQVHTIKENLAICIKGLTLIEVIFVILIVAILMIPLASQFKGVRVVWETGNKRADLFQNTRIGFDKIIRELRAAKQIVSVTASGDDMGRIEFIDKDDNTAIFERFLSGGKYWLGYTTGGASPSTEGDILAGPINTLKFTCYKDDGITVTTKRRAIMSIGIEMEVASDEGGINPETFASRVIIEKGLITIAINEIHYNPPAGYSDMRYEYVELYNHGSVVIDVNGWSFSDSGATDTLQGDSFWGDGSTVIPAGGYVIITDTDTQIYTEMTILNGGFERGDLSMWQMSGSWQRRNGGHSGNRRIQISGAGQMYQQISIPVTATRADFYFWERQSGTRLIVTVRDTLNNVLMTIYDGPMSGGTWTQHTADLSVYIGAGPIRIYFQTFAGGQYWLDDITIKINDAVRLQVSDTAIGNGLSNNNETLTLQLPGANGQVVDSVFYDDSWGADGNGNTLERIDSEDDSNDPLNWAESAQFFGTPGYKNNATP